MLCLSLLSIVAIAIYSFALAPFSLISIGRTGQPTSDDRTSCTCFGAPAPGSPAWPAGGFDAPTGPPLEDVGLFSAGAGAGVVPSDMVLDGLRWWNLWEEKSDVGEEMPVIIGVPRGSGCRFPITRFLLWGYGANGQGRAAHVSFPVGRFGRRGPGFAAERLFGSSSSGQGSRERSPTRRCE